MKRTFFISLFLIFVFDSLIVSCGGGGGSDNANNSSFTITYIANRAETGTVPASQHGDEDCPQSIQANTGNLLRNGYLFDGWNTSADGLGTNYVPGTSYKGKSVILYAKWAAIFNIQIISLGSPSPVLNGVQKAIGGHYIKILGLTAKGKSLANIIIPATIDGYPVMSIGSGAFQGCDFVTSITIPNTVTTIENNAFEGCTGITELIIPISVTSIGNNVFSGCTGLQRLIMLNTVPPTMGIGSFEGCPVTISVPAAGYDDYMVEDGWNTYSANIAGYSTESYTVTFSSPDATTNANPESILIEPPAFTVEQLPTSPKRTGYLFGGWYKEPGGVGDVFTASTVVSGNITVFANWESYNYTVTFDDQDATTYVSPTSKTVESPATTVDALPAAPEKEGYIFGGWYTEINGGGTQFTVGSVVTGNITVFAKWIENGLVYCTYETNGTNITITGLTTEGKQQTVIVLPDKIDGKNVTNIGDNAFKGNTTLKEITINQNIEHIGDYAFQGCTKLFRARLGEYAFLGSNTQDFRLSKIIPSNLSSIGTYAFSATAVNGAAIPSSVTTMGSGVFNTISTYRSIYIQHVIPPNWGPGSIRTNEIERFGFYVPKDSLNAYRNKGWKNENGVSNITGIDFIE